MENVNIAVGIVITLLIYVAGLSCYRLWFSPVAAVPGPLLAKLTYWYEFYWDVVKVGQYTFRIRELHDKYGPIVRVNPDEVHIDDPDFYDELYASAASGKKRNKWSWWVDGFGLTDSMFATIDHDRHRARRAALNQFFSKAKVRALQGNIERIGQKLVTRISEFKDRHESMPIGLAFTAFTNDIASAYAFDTRKFRVDAPDFAPDFHIAAESVTNSAHLGKHFPWFINLIQRLPPSWVTILDPRLGAFMDLQNSLQIKTKEIQAAYHSPDYKPPKQTTVFHEILNSPHLSDSDKSHSRLWREAQTVVTAGTATTAKTLSVLTFFLLTHPTKLKRLREELYAAIPDKTAPMQLHVLEKLPYLTACITETLRYSPGISTRLHRIDPEKPITFHAKKHNLGASAPADKAYILPSGTPISMTTLLIHYNPRIFPDPYAFIPERWLERDPATNTDTVHRNLDKYFSPFNKGTRGCIGITLAWAELYLLTAMIWRRYGAKEDQVVGDEGYLELFDSSYERDIEIIGDGFTPLVREPFKGVKVMVHSCDGGVGDE